MNGTVRKGRRGATFSKAEITVLLNIVANLLPFGADQWEKVGDEFLQEMTNTPIVRDTESLRSKYKALRKHKKPTYEFITLIPLP